MESQVARHSKSAKRANRRNPREERNILPFDPDDDIFFDRPARTHRLSSKSHQQRQSPQPRFKPVELTPRNRAQHRYVQVFDDPAKNIVFAIGPAGCGKTLLATQFAIRQLQSGNVDKIIITRPAVSVDEQHGFLPGDLLQKMAPWVIPILDVFKEYYPVASLTKMLESELVEVAPLAFMRGRTLKNAIVIADEMQNATPSQMKMLLTRIGENSRMIVTGDLRQHDRGFEANGLRDFMERLKIVGSSRIAVCEFSAGDVERHEVIEDVLRIYGDE
jgi:phosphate starvation-inducible PhoH-like protein